MVADRGMVGPNATGLLHALKVEVGSVIRIRPLGTVEKNRQTLCGALDEGQADDEGDKPREATDARGHKGWSITRWRW